MTAFITRKRLVWLIGILASSAILYIVLPVSVPLIMALFTAILLEPLVKFLITRFSLKRSLAIIIVFILFILLIGLGGYLLTTKMTSEIIKLANHAPLYINEISKFWFEVKHNLLSASEELPKQFINQLSTQFDGVIFNLRDALLTYVNINNLKTVLTNIPNYLVSFLVYLIALFLFLLDLPRIRRSIDSHLKEKTAEKVNLMIFRLSFVVFSFLRVQLFISILVFVVSLIGLFFISPRAAVPMAVLIWIFDFIPILGSVAILGPWALFLLLNGEIWTGIQLSVLAAFLFAIRRIIEPRMRGSHIRLSPLSTLVCMYLGFKVIGIIGLVIGPLLLIGFNSAKEAGIIKFNLRV